MCFLGAVCMVATRWQQRHCAVGGLVSMVFSVETIINHSVPLRRGIKKTIVDPNEPVSVPDCLGSSTLFLSTLSEIQLLQSFGARCGCLPRPFGQCRVQWFCLRGRLCWCQSLVLEVIFQRLGQREPLDLLKPIPTQRQAGRSPTQVH